MRKRCVHCPRPAQASLDSVPTARPTALPSGRPACGLLVSVSILNRPRPLPVSARLASRPDAVAND
eukprot:11253600-Alexandrium_andersonii.AAC.1